MFSIAVRKRDTDEDGICKCGTCTLRTHWSQLTCGHLRKRRHMATRWKLKNAGPQCSICNGKDLSMADYIDKTFGVGTADEMRALSLKDVHFGIEDLKSMIKELSKFI